jgi:hypothetical protein
MGMHIDTDDVASAAGTRALLDQLDDRKMLSLGVLSGAELCMLGGAEHPVCWEALKDAWQQLDPAGRQQLAETGTARLLHRGLIEEQPAGRGVRALFFPACYKPSAELAILLSARESPASVIATHHESRSPGVVYFHRQGTIVEEIPERAGNGTAGAARSALDVIFSYRLLTLAFAAEELARWALKPVRAARHQPAPPRLICFSGGAESDSPQSYQLAMHGNGQQAHVEGPDVSAKLDRQVLTRFMTDLVIKWAETANVTAAETL